MNLHFEDKHTEQAFILSYEKKSRENILPGLLSSLFIWYIGVGLTYLIIPQHVAWLALVIVLTTHPYFFFVIYTAYHDRYFGHYQWMLALTNAGAGMLTIYFFSFFPSGEYYTLITLIFILFFGLNAYQLQVIYIVTASLTYIAGFQLYILLYADLKIADITLFSVVVWVAEAFVVWVAYKTERTDRTLFAQQKTILDQQKIIQKEKEEAERANQAKSTFWPT